MKSGDNDTKWELSKNPGQEACQVAKVRSGQVMFDHLESDRFT